VQRVSGTAKNSRQPTPTTRIRSHRMCSLEVSIEPTAVRVFRYFAVRSLFAAAKITPATSFGFEIIATWLAGAEVTTAFIRCAIAVCAWGAIM